MKDNQGIEVQMLLGIFFISLFLLWISLGLANTSSIKEEVKKEVPEESYYEVTKQQQQIIDETISNIEVVINQYKYEKIGKVYEKTVSFNKEEYDHGIFFENEFLRINSKYLIRKNENEEDKIILKMKVYRNSIGNTCRALLKQMDEKGLIYGTYREVELNNIFKPLDGKYKSICSDFMDESIAFNIN